MWWKVHLETPFSDRRSRSEHGSGDFAKPVELTQEELAERAGLSRKAIS
jgi:hypothetical protein